MDYGKFEISADKTHHLVDGTPAYENRFESVGKFHEPGLAPVRDESGAYHIRTDGSSAYSRRFLMVFGFYDERAAVLSEDGWHHILEDGTDLYPERYAWAGNFQEGRCTVRNSDGFYFYLRLSGRPQSERRYLFAGDFRNGIAVVRSEDGLCSHIDRKEKLVHKSRYPDLDIYHKGYARARDSQGWFHIDMEGVPAYEERYSDVEPFYNGFAHVLRFDGTRAIVDEKGMEVHRITRTGEQRSSSGTTSSTNATGIMKILIIGNLGAGKTTLGQSVSREMGIPLHTIDDYRKRFSDGTYSGEYFALASFLVSIESAQAGIYEFTGVGIHKHAVRYCLNNKKHANVVVRVLVRGKSNRERIADKKWDIPFPFKMDLKDHMDYVDRKLIEDKESGFWEMERADTHIIDIDNTKNDHQMRAAKELIERIKELEVQ